MSDDVWDAAIVGAGPSGLSASLVLGRQLWKAVVIDDRQYRNANASEAHSYLTRDGCSPYDLLAAARQDVCRYPSVRLVDGAVTSIAMSDGHFVVSLGAGRLTARTIVLATGLEDVVDGIDGLSERFGSTIFHCLLCHGNEVQGKSVGVIGDSDVSVFQASYLAAKFSDDVSLITNSDTPLDAADTAKLSRMGVDVVEGRLRRVGGSLGRLDLHLDSGRRLTKYAAFYHAATRQRSSLPSDLGCRFLPDGRVEVDCFQLTSVPGILAVGDMARQESMLGNMMFIANAVASGVRAAAWLDEELYLNST